MGGQCLLFVNSTSVIKLCVYVCTNLCDKAKTKQNKIQVNLSPFRLTNRFYLFTIQSALIYTSKHAQNLTHTHVSQCSWFHHVCHFVAENILFPKLAFICTGKMPKILYRNIYLFATVLWWNFCCCCYCAILTQTRILIAFIHFVIYSSTSVFVIRYTKVKRNNYNDNSTRCGLLMCKKKNQTQMRDSV